MHKADLPNHGQDNSTLVAFGRSPRQVSVILSQSEVMHFWLAMPTMLHQIRSLYHEVHVKSSAENTLWIMPLHERRTYYTDQLQLAFQAEQASCLVQHGPD